MSQTSNRLMPPPAAFLLLTGLIVTVALVPFVKIHWHWCDPFDSGQLHLISFNEDARTLQLHGQRHDALGEVAAASQDYTASLRAKGFSFIEPALRPAWRAVAEARTHADDADYLWELICRDGIMYWKKDRFPLKIFVPDDTYANGFSGAEQALIEACLNEWMSAAPGLLSYRMVGQDDNADITFSRKSGSGGMGLSQTQVARTLPIAEAEEIWSVCAIHKVVVEIGAPHRPLTADSFGAAKRKEVFQHEIGHALGLAGHSCHARDMMFFTSREPNCCVSISQRDKQTLSSIYREPNLERMAEQYIRQRADRGDKHAICTLAKSLMRTRASETPAAKVQIFSLLKQAADLGLPVAQTAVGRAYAEGYGTKRDITTAVKYLSLAADQEHGPALRALANLYAHGQGVRRNLELAQSY